MFFHYCGKQIKDHELFCPYCGKNIEVNKESETSFPKAPKEKRRGLLHLLIALFLFLLFIGGAIKIISVNLSRKANENIIGIWTVDVEKTDSANDLSLQYAFGSGIRYGYEMVLNKDGTASWSIGIGNGGEGTYTIQDSAGKLNYIDYEDKTEKTVALSILEESGNDYILMEYDGYTLYWTKKDETAKPLQ